MMMAAADGAFVLGSFPPTPSSGPRRLSAAATDAQRPGMRARVHLEHQTSLLRAMLAAAAKLSADQCSCLLLLGAPGC